MSGLIIIEKVKSNNEFTRNIYQVPEGAMIKIKENQLWVEVPSGHKDRYPDPDPRHFKVSELVSIEIRDHGVLIFETNGAGTNIVPRVT